MIDEFNLISLLYILIINSFFCEYKHKILSFDNSQIFLISPILETVLIILYSFLSKTTNVSKYEIVIILLFFNSIISSLFGISIFIIDCNE